jgi:hypothetical protein
VERANHVLRQDALERCAALPLYANAPFDFRSLEAGIGLAPPLDRYRDVQVRGLARRREPAQGAEVPGCPLLRRGRRGRAEAPQGAVQVRDEAAAYKRFRAEGHSVAVAKELSKTDAIPGKTWGTLTAEDIADYAAKDADLTARVYDYLLAHRGVRRHRAGGAADCTTCRRRRTG